MILYVGNTKRTRLFPGVVAGYMPIYRKRITYPAGATSKILHKLLPVTLRVIPFLNLMRPLHK